MKRVFFFGMAVLLFWTCSTNKETSKTSVSLAKNSPDSSQYEILIIDPEFDQWYQRNYVPSKDRPVEYYRGRNIQAVARWNEFFTTGRYRNVVESIVDYHPEIDYGIEVNRKLYWYFDYVETRYHIPLFITR
jgi:hypothetical protein